MRKILGSSSFAVAKYLEALIERLQRRKAASLSMTDEIEDFGTTVEEADQDLDEDEDVHITPEMIEAEILELQSYLELAQSISKNAKGEELLKRLPQVMDEIHAKGGKGQVTAVGTSDWRAASAKASPGYQCRGADCLELGDCRP